MSTEYYLRKDRCKHCNHYTEIKIGLQAAGWKFNFESYKELKISTREDWQPILEKVEWGPDEIYDEYGREVPYRELVDMIKRNQDRRSMSEEHPEHCIKDDKGYEMMKED